ncbi:MAG: hypothetical protein JWO52_7485 [Gammaproteobacteria bacterium]|nr:hypothetical protein [Gammaproteobacteria bacterium]
MPLNRDYEPTTFMAAVTPLKLNLATRSARLDKFERLCDRIVTFSPERRAPDLVPSASGNADDQGQRTFSADAVELSA